MTHDLDTLELGYDIPARPGMAAADICTPALVLDLYALERNISKMGQVARALGVRHRSHGKMHKSVDLQRLQQDLGGACGVCCQKVSEAEAFARGGITDILITNQVTRPDKIARMTRLPSLGARVICCVDDAANVADLSSAAIAAGVSIECLVEIDIGAGRCGVAGPAEAVALARAIEDSAGLRFSGVQAYHGSLQHLPTHGEREAASRAATARTRAAVEGLRAAGFSCDIVGGGGTGSFEQEAKSGVYNELQCGSYAVMDADYGRLLDADGLRLDRTWKNALFVQTTVMSCAVPGGAVVDAGHKACAVDSGLPVVFGRGDLRYVDCADEHGVLEDPGGLLRVNDVLRLVPGHCDPTCNLHDWLVCVRGEVVEAVWPITARGKGY